MKVDKKFIVVFTNGSATSVIARSLAEAKRMLQGSPDQSGDPRKIHSIKQTNGGVQ